MDTDALWARLKDLESQLRDVLLVVQEAQEGVRNALDAMTNAAPHTAAEQERAVFSRFLELYMPGTQDLRIVRAPEAFPIVLGRAHPRVRHQPNVLQFYTIDKQYRIDFPLVPLKGCHTFMLMKYVGASGVDPCESAESDWEFEDFVFVKKYDEASDGTSN